MSNTYTTDILKSFEAIVNNCTVFVATSEKKLAEMYTEKQLQAFAKLLGVTLVGDQRKKTIKAEYVRQIKQSQQYFNVVESLDLI